MWFGGTSLGRSTACPEPTGTSTHLCGVRDIRTTWALPVPGRSGAALRGGGRRGSGRSFQAKTSVGVNVDAVPVRVGNLDTGEAAFILPFGFGHASFAQPITGASNLVRIRHLKTEVVGAR